MLPAGDFLFLEKDANADFNVLKYAKRAKLYRNIGGEFMLANLEINTQSNLEINIGIDAESRQEIAAGLPRVLAAPYTLYLKTDNFHWNVTEPLFTSPHQLFEAQYAELAGAVDEIAERIRALGRTAAGSYREFSSLSVIPETEAVPSAEKMIRQLVKGHEAVVSTARSVVPVVERSQD